MTEYSRLGQPVETGRFGRTLFALMKKAIPDESGYATDVVGIEMGRSRRRPDISDSCNQFPAWQRGASLTPCRQTSIFG